MQQHVGRNLSVSAGYVGTRSQHLSYTHNDNGFETVCPGCFSPFAFATSSPGAPNCFNATGLAEDSAPNATDCQFTGNNGAVLRGPGFQWSNLDLAKTVRLTERVSARIDLQGYNIFNHPNFANPDTTAAAGTADEPGTGAITSLTSPNNGLLGDGNGGDSAPRMFAFQAKIVF